MNIRGKIKLLTDNLCKNWFFVLLMVIMCTIAMYMIDTVMSNYFYSAETLRKWREPYAENIENVYCARYNIENNKTVVTGNELVNMIDGVEGVKYSGRFMDSAVQMEEGKMYDIVIAERTLIDISNTGLKEKELLEAYDYSVDLCPVFVGYNLRDTYAVGYTFSIYDSIQDNCVVVGYLPKGASWIYDGVRIDGNSNRCLDNKMLLLPKNYTDIYFFENIVGIIDVYYVCEDGREDDVCDAIYGEVAKKDISLVIYSMGEELEKKSVENNLVNDKEFISTVLITVIAMVSISTSAIVMSLSRRKYYGVMYAFGVSIDDISWMIVAENLFIILVSSVIAWVIRTREINERYFYDEGMIEMASYIEPILETWNYAQNIMSTGVMVGCGFVMLLVASIVPVRMLRRQQPVDMIKFTE